MGNGLKSMVPELRFGEFNSDWVFGRVDEFCPLQRGFDLPVKDVNKGKFPVVFSNGIKKFHNEFKAKAPGVVTGRSGTIGKVTFVEQDYWPHNTSLWVTSFKENIPKYIYYFLYQLKLERFGTGSGVPTLNRNDVHAYKTSIPKDRKEQQKIANFLTSVDQCISLLKQKKAALEQYKKGLMQKIFNQEIRFKDDNGEDYLDWEEKRLGEIGDFKNGINKGKSDFGFGVPFVNLMDVFGKTILKKQEFGLVNATENEIKQYELLEGDVLFIRSSVKRSGVGETIVITENLYKTVYSGFLIRFRDENYISKEFKKYCFWDINFRNQLVSLSTSSANTNINQESLKILKISLPTISEQQKIAYFLSSIDKSINKLKKQIEQTTVFKKGLLKMMFV